MTPTDEAYMIVRLERRWEDLKNYIENEIPNLDGKPPVLFDYLTGYGNALENVLEEIKDLEEK